MRRGLRKNTARKSLRPRGVRASDAPRSSLAPAQRMVSGRAPRGQREAEQAAAPTETAQHNEEPPARHSQPDRDALSHEFFSSLPHAHSIDVWDDQHMPTPMAHGARRAMIASGVIFGVFLTAILLYTGYHQWIMPEPVELGGGVPVQTPVPLAAPAVREPPAAAAQPTIAPPPSAEAPTAEAPVAPVLVAAPPAEQLASANSLGPSYTDLIAAGEALNQSGQRTDALDAYERALALRPDSAQALAHIAYLHLNTGATALAKQFAVRAVISDPTSSEGWIVLGAAQAALGDRVAAQTSYRKCAALGVGAYVRECEQLLRR